MHGELIKDLLIKNLSVNSTNITSIQYGCNIKPPILTREHARKHLNLNIKNKIVALFFGVIRSDKGLIEILENFNKVSNDIILLIAGSEGDIKKSTVEHTIKTENIEDRVIQIIRYLEEDEIQYCFYASDFVLIPHKGNHLAFSGPLSIAVEHCRPVLASDIGEIGSFVKNNKIGALFKHDNWDNFVSVLNDSRFNFSEFDEKVFSNIQDQNSWENMAWCINNVYKKVFEKQETHINQPNKHK